MVTVEARPLPSRPRSPRTRAAGAEHLHGLDAAPTGLVDICNQHAGSGKGRAARPGGKLTLTLSLIKQNNRAASWSGDVAAAGGAGLGAFWDRHPPPPRRDEPTSAGRSHAGSVRPKPAGESRFPQTLPSRAGKHHFPSPFCPSLYGQRRRRPSRIPAPAGSWGVPGGLQCGGKVKEALGSGFR